MNFLIGKKFDICKYVSKKFLGASLINTCFNVIYIEQNRRYMTCMGKQERYFYDLDDFTKPIRKGPLNSLPFYNPVK